MNKTDEHIYKVTRQVVHKYRHDLKDEDHILWMLTEIRKEFNDSSKTNRWLGFIHGVLVSHTQCTIDELRDVIRNAYKN